MDIGQFRVGIFQLSSHPSVCLADRDLLMEPLFPIDQSISLTVLAREIVDLRPCLADTKERYLKWHSDRLELLLTWLMSESTPPDILVFPECGVPFECLERLRQFAETTGTTIFAGTHTPRSDKKSLSHYKKSLGVRSKHFKDLENQPPPAVLPVITPKGTVLHRKAVPSVFERVDVRPSTARAVTSKTIAIGDSSIRVAPLVCAEALHLTTWEHDFPDLVVIVAMDQNPHRFNSLIETLVSNQVPTILANDGAYGGSGVFTSVDRRTATWWYGPPNHGRLPACDAYLEVSLNLKSTAVQVGVANPSQTAHLNRLAPICSADSEVLQVEQKIQEAIKTGNQIALQILRRDLSEQSSGMALTSRRLAFLEALASNGTLSSDVTAVVAPHISLAPQFSLRRLEASLSTEASAYLGRLLDTDATSRLPDDVFAPLVRAHRYLKERSEGNVNATPRVSQSAPPIGRSDDIRDIRQFAAAGPPNVMVVTGLEAVGKTTVVEAALRQCAARELVIECLPGMSADALFETLLKFTGRIPTGEAPRARFAEADLADALADLEMVCFRDCHHLLEYGAWRTNALSDFFNTLLSARQRTAAQLLFESRRGLNFDTSLGTQIGRKRIDGLPREDGVAFLDQQIKRAGGWPDSVSPDQKQSIVKMAAGHPGMLVLCADVAAKVGAQRVLDELESRKGFFFSSVRRMLGAVQLSSDAESCLWLLSNCRLPVPFDVIEKGCDAHAAIPELLDVCLVNRTPDGCYEIIGLLKEVELETGSSTEESVSAFDRAASSYFAHLASTEENIPAYRASVEANYHASLAGIEPPCSTGGLLDSLAAAAQIEFDLQRYGRVIQMLEGIAEAKMPEDLLATLSLSYAWTNRFEEAFRIADKVVGTNRTYVSLFTDACNAAIRSRNWKTARDALQRAERLEPGFYQIHRFNGQIAEHDGRLPEAIQHYKASVQATERDPWPYFFLARAYVRIGQPEKALDVVDAAAEFVGSYRRRNFENALLSQQLLATVIVGREDAAQKMLDVLDQREGSSPEMIVTAAYVRAYLSDDENGSLQAFSKALVSLRSEDSRKAHIRAKIAMYKGKLAERVGGLRDAETSYSEACRLDQHNVHMKECLLRVLRSIANEAKQGDQRSAETSAANRAIEVASSILEYEPNHVGALNALEDVHFLHGVG